MLELNTVHQGDCLELMKDIPQDSIIVTDPPFNIGYKYNSYKDKMVEDEYYDMLANLFGDKPFVIVHYPEQIYKLAIRLGRAPEKVVSWVYNANTPRQHRDIAYFGIKPEFKGKGAEYKNPNDKRIAERIARGEKPRLYDWWNIQQVKNVSSDKTEHPCQMPVEVMENIIKTLPKNCVIVDPFAGSGTTGVAAKNLGRNFILIEQDEKYCEIIRERLVN